MLGRTSEDLKKAVYLAVQNENTSFLNALFKADAKTTYQDEQGDTALHLAVRKKNLVIFELLIKHKAKSLKANKNKVTPLAEIIALLADDTDEKQQLAKNCLNMLLDNLAPDTVSTTFSFGKALIIAIQRGHSDLAKKLIEKGVSLEIYPINGRSPLHLAVLKRDIELVRLLIAKKCKKTAFSLVIDFVLKAESKEIDTAKTLARIFLESSQVQDNEVYRHNLLNLCKSQTVNRELQIYIVSALLKLGIKSTQDEEANNPLHFAVKNKNLPLIKILIEAEISSIEKNLEQKSPIQIMIESTSALSDELSWKCLEAFASNPKIRESSHIYTLDYEKALLHAVKCNRLITTSLFLQAGVFPRKIKKTDVLTAAIAVNNPLMISLLKQRNISWSEKIHSLATKEDTKDALINPQKYTYGRLQLIMMQLIFAREYDQKCEFHRISAEIFLKIFDQVFFEIGLYNTKGNYLLVNEQYNHFKQKREFYSSKALINYIKNNSANNSVKRRTKNIILPLDADTDNFLFQLKISQTMQEPDIKITTDIIQNFSDKNKKNYGNTGVALLMDFHLFAATEKNKKKHENAIKNKMRETLQEEKQGTQLRYAAD